jgi:hypothetical protein
LAAGSDSRATPVSPHRQNRRLPEWYSGVVEAREEFDADALVALIFFDLLDVHGFGGKDETVVLDRNPADFPEDLLAMFKGGIATAQQIEISCRSMQRASPDLKKHCAFQDELIPEG